MRIAVVARHRTPANLSIVETCCRGVEWDLLTPEAALAELEPGDAALGRIDVSPSLDGVDDGMWVLGELAARGVTVFNGASFLLAAHDKLLTARVLRRAGLPHPRTRLLTGDRPFSPLRPPVVVKPRFGSWGLAVERCDSERELEETLAALPLQLWYQAQGAIIQELVPPHGFDLRVVVACGYVVGAISRVAVPGEWRTNVSLGAERQRVTPPPEAAALALAAANATGAALVGVDLLPDGNGRWTVAEINGAVEFNEEYAIDRQANPFADVAFRLAEAAICARVVRPAHVASALHR